MTARTISAYVAVLCRDCGVIFSHHHVRGNLPIRCEECRWELDRARQRQWYEANRERALDYARERWLATTPRVKEMACRDCGTTVQIKVARGRNSYLCPGCRDTARLAATARYREQNRDAIREKGKLYRAKRYQDDPEFRSAQLKWSKFQRETSRKTIYQKDLGICHLCQQPVAWDDFEIDHVIPRALGGSDHESNLRVSHRFCNRSKGARLGN